MSNQPVIVAAKRTPIGKFLGGYTNTPSPKLGSYAIRAVLDEVPGASDHVDECVMGCVLQGGLGQNPARQAGLGAGLGSSLSAVTVNKVCGSGLQAVMQAATTIRAGEASCIVAGGFENMTAAPHFAFVRTGVKYGPTQLEDLMAHDGLTCAFECWPMGNAAEQTAKKHGISRGDQDALGARSHRLAAQAWDNGWFDAETVALTGEQVGNRKNPGPEGGVSRDEGIRADSTPEGLGKLRPAFDKNGTITAGNASQISDGAAAVLVMSESRAKELGVAPLARIVSHATSGVEPRDIFEAPITGVRMALQRANMGVGDIDLFEINEAFAAQVLCNARALEVPEDKLNLTGGGIALGHPIGASGARVLTTLIHQLKRTGGATGVAALCLGGGNSVAMVIERV